MKPIPSHAETVSRIQIIDEARAWIGTPYIHQASAKGAGCDCLGLVRGVWRALYGGEPEAPPPYTPDWNERAFGDGASAGPGAGAGSDILLAAADRHMRARDEGFEPGDLLIFRVDPAGPAKHCGIASGDGRFIHAYAGRAVVESWLNRWWRARLAGVFMFPGA